jgi:hypothetical protein
MSADDKEIVTGRQHIPTWAMKLASDPELRRQQKRLREQNEWRLSNTRDNAIVTYASREVELARANLDILSETHRPSERKRLVENLIILGRFDEALKYAEHSDIEKIRKLKAAIEKDDNQKCDCERRTVQNKSKGKIISEETPRYTEYTRIYSQEHEAVVPVMQCGVCGNWNATPNINGDKNQKVDKNKLKVDKREEVEK